MEISKSYILMEETKNSHCTEVEMHSVLRLDATRKKDE
jgi:hypothetical protein